MNALEVIQDKGLLGERLCLDFTNTTSEHPVPDDEVLTEYPMLVYWGVFEHLLNDHEAGQLLRIAEAQPEAAADTLKEALMLRETLYRILVAEVDRNAVDPADMEAFHQALVQGLPFMRLMRGDDGTYGWAGSGREDDLGRILWPVVWDAADLLQSTHLGQVRKCAGGGCDWLFLDTSRNHSRCWCNMQTCGNRAKVRNHYQRKRSTHLQR